MILDGDIMTKSLIKNTFREIKNSKARFISIMAIIALGVGFFSGIKSTVPSMYNLAENYYRSQNLMDYRLVSTVGFDEDDVQAVKNTDGVKDVMPSYFCDAIISEQSGGEVVRVIAVPKAYKDNDELNTLTLKEGRLPEKENEILVEYSGIKGGKYKVGDKIVFQKESGNTDLSEQLKTLEFTIVGKVNSPLYISYQRGTTNIGDGSITEFMYIPQQAFDTDLYTELYVKSDFSNNVSAFDEEYNTKVESLSETLEKTANARCEYFDTNTIQKAKDELSDSKEELKTEKDKAYKELDDAAKELESSKNTFNNEISSAQAKLDDAKKQIDDGNAEYKKSYDAYYSEIEKAQQTIEQNEKKIKDSQSQYNKAKAEFEEQISSAQKQIDDGLEEYNAAYEQFKNYQEPQLVEGVAQAQSAVDTIKQSMGLVTDEETLAALQAQLTVAQTQLDELNSTYDEAVKQLEQSKSTLDKSQQELDAKKAQGQAELDKSYEQLQSAIAALNTAKAQLDAQKTQGLEQLNQARSELDAAQSEYDEGVKELEEQKTEGQQKLDDAQKQYDDGKKEADEKFAEAEEKINDAQKEVDELESPEWYVFTRDDNPGYSTFSSNAERLDAVATVFPMFFLLVAVLVCVTTMTRLIEEKRTEIGTLKALGYGNFSIVMKFVIYSVIAAVIGSVIGTLLGVFTLPFVIYDAYKIMYYIGDITLKLDVLSVILSCAAAILCTTVVSIVVCARSLHHKPAEAMRPKAPKPGKRIALEYIKPIWSHLSFTKKLTARNLFRYKTRMFMTIIGIAGCTALIVAAFGLLNSFDPLTKSQFSEIFKYDAVVIPEDGQSTQELDGLLKDVSAQDNVKYCMRAAQLDAEVEFNGKVKDSETYLSVMEDTENIDKIVSFHTRKGKKTLKLDDSGVIINEKLADELGVSVGDTIKVTADSKSVNVKVSGINEHYIYNYVHITPNLYKELFGEAAQYNMIDTVFNDKSDSAQNEFSSELLKDDRISAVSFVNSSVEEFDSMLSSLNMVVAVMIICAAALAFVVLYNLTNINIAERVREIATFKVLGFYNRETSSMIYRENIVLTVLGIFVGFAMGFFLTHFIVQTVEVDNVMFGRDIYFTSYLYAAAFTLLFSIIVNAVMSFKIKAVNMVESLKSIE